MCVGAGGEAGKRNGENGGRDTASPGREETAFINKLATTEMGHTSERKVGRGGPGRTGGPPEVREPSIPQPGQDRRSRETQSEHYLAGWVFSFS